MNNFSSHFLLQNPQHPNIQSIQQEERKEEFEEEKARCEWDFNLSTVISSGGSVSDTVGVLEFDPSDRLLATGGMARKIRIYSINSILFPCEENNSKINLLDHATACEFYICTPAKLSSLRWKPGSGGKILGSADYDGVITEYDLERRVPVFERDEHGGRRVWSMDYSDRNPVIGASGSDDGTMQMWDTRCDTGNCLGSVQPSIARSPVCCVEFNPFEEAFIAVGCADRRVYGYDVRNISVPVLTLEGHEKAITYVRFLDRNTIVTSAVDGCLKMWRIQDQRIIRTYKGHVNSRRFVGLSVWKDGGLLSCGSENNRVVVYDKRWGEPIWVHEFGSNTGTRTGADADTDAITSLGWEEHGLVSSVCWRQVGEAQCTLVAAGSNGVLQVFNGRRR